jgi:hypothetical protein
MSCWKSGSKSKQPVYVPAGSKVAAAPVKLRNGAGLAAGGLPLPTASEASSPPQCLRLILPGASRQGLTRPRDPSGRQLGFESLGSSSWPCHLRAHGEEQNGSLFLRATSGRSLPHHTQRPFGRTGGSAFIDCSFSTTRVIGSLQRGLERP